MKRVLDPDFYREARLHIARVQLAQLLREREAWVDIERRSKIPLGHPRSAAAISGAQSIEVIVGVQRKNRPPTRRPTLPASSRPPADCSRDSRLAGGDLGAHESESEDVLAHFRSTADATRSFDSEIASAESAEKTIGETA